MYEIKGHHHISMVTKNANENNHFYKNVLGLRRVKMTVNQDDPSMYHLFYGDKTGSPGTELSFFEIPLVGKRTVVRTQLLELDYSFLPRKACITGKNDLRNLM